MLATFFSEGVRAGYVFFLNIIQCESNEKRYDYSGIGNDLCWLLFFLKAYGLDTFF